MGYGLGGLLLSLISLADSVQPVSLGLICALTGWRALAAALGSFLGMELFWAGELQGRV